MMSRDPGERMGHRSNLNVSGQRLGCGQCSYLIEDFTQVTLSLEIVATETGRALLL